MPHLGFGGKDAGISKHPRLPAQVLVFKISKESFIKSGEPLIDFFFNEQAGSAGVGDFNVFLNWGDIYLFVGTAIADTKKMNLVSSGIEDICFSVFPEVDFWLGKGDSVIGVRGSNEFGKPVGIDDGIGIEENGGIKFFLKDYVESFFIGAGIPEIFFVFYNSQLWMALTNKCDGIIC